MDRRPAHLNRTGLILLGLVLAVPGAAALARGLGLFGDGRASGAVLSGQVHRYVDDHGWFWPAVAAIAVVLALLGLAWLLAQGRSSKLQRLTLEPDPASGMTQLSGKAVTNALESEIEEYPGVQSARARLLGSSKRPKLRLSVTYSRRADLADLRHRIGDEALQRLCTALERESVPTVVRLRLVQTDRPTTI
ncbi:alkaline shock response membrane anchor protein AmaP [Actinomadura rubrisoli]|uniref:Alkaline shock response membrane anchor protein AmaP n=1 Tax=Actinomadura rubrisoli TaxID=2530368 RepID=A0A4R4ZTJ2_9ACTN|nr:alkaline shock response membrane anchor protein AmaP [Actinomadura rubrisoli]TDD61646.1 alkaline shock response membrane anchor protein AmaP [Actinomadura rubrisoli]